MVNLVVPQSFVCTSITTFIVCLVLLLLVYVSVSSIRLGVTREQRPCLSHVSW